MGERQFPVPPLFFGERSSPAVRLFCERAVAVAPSFELTAANAPTLREICRRLDGLPLAIELAAARIKLFSPEALLDRLDRRLQLLSGGARDLPERQRTLRDTVAWSHDLLDEDEQSLFGRMSVFAGGFSLEAAETICGTEMPGGGDVLETLASLVDNSLVVSRSGVSAGQEDGEPRFAMLETIKEYAAERLRSSGEDDEVRRTHAHYYLALAEYAQPENSPTCSKSGWWCWSVIMTTSGWPSAGRSGTGRRTSGRGWPYCCGGSGPSTTTWVKAAGGWRQC
jgi:predicted ATPase